MQVHKMLHEYTYFSGTGTFHKEKEGLCGESIGVCTEMKCPRCNGHNFFLGYDASEPFISCAKKKCMKENCEYTKKIDREKKAKEKAERAPIYDSGAKRFRLPSRFHHACLSQIKYDQEDMKKLNKWINKPEYFLVIVGSPGTGKTFLMAAMLNHFAQKYTDVYYLNTRAFLKRLTDAISDNNSTYHLIEQICDHDLILFDDFGASSFTEWQKEIFQYLIDHLYENQIPCAITTNLYKDEIEEKTHPRVSDRLFASQNEQIYFTDFNYRRQNM